MMWSNHLDRLVICPFLILAISHFGSKDKILAMIVPVPGHCLFLLLSRHGYKLHAHDLVTPCTLLLT